MDCQTVTRGRPQPSVLLGTQPGTPPRPLPFLGPGCTLGSFPDPLDSQPYCCLSEGPFLTPPLPAVLGLPRTATVWANPLSLSLIVMDVRGSLAEHLVLVPFPFLTTHYLFNFLARFLSTKIHGESTLCQACAGYFRAKG